MEEHPGSGAEFFNGKLLIIKTHALGDVLLTTPAIRAIRRGYPDAEITFLTGEWSAPAVELNPNIDRLIVVLDKILFNHKVMELGRLVRNLRKRQFDMAIIFQPSYMVHFLPMLSGIKRRVGFSLKEKEMGLTVCVPWENNKRYIADVYMDIVRKLGLDTEPLELEFHGVSREDPRMREILNECSWEPGRPVVGMFAGGGINPRDCVFEKLWDMEKFGQLGNYLQKKYRARLVLVGSEKESTINRSILHAVRGKAIDLSGKITFTELGTLMESFHLFITNDSAPLHLAVARQVPTVSIFGPTDPSVLVPRDPKHMYVTSKLECCPCYSNEVFNGCKDFLCMNSITLDQVIEKVDLQMLRVRNRLLEEEDTHV